MVTRRTSHNGNGNGKRSQRFGGRHRRKQLQSYSSGICHRATQLQLYGTCGIGTLNSPAGDIGTAHGLHRVSFWNRYFQLCQLPLSNCDIDTRSQCEARILHSQSRRGSRMEHDIRGGLLHRRQPLQANGRKLRDGNVDCSTFATIHICPSVNSCIQSVRG